MVLAFGGKLWERNTSDLRFPVDLNAAFVCVFESLFATTFPTCNCNFL